MSSYEPRGDTLTFGLAASTLMACPPDFTMIEKAMATAMEATSGFRIGGE